MQPIEWINAALNHFRERRRMAAACRERKRVLRQQVEEVVSATEPGIRLVDRYEQRLQPAVESALEHCWNLVAEIPGPFDIRADRWGKDPLVTAYFATVGEAKSALETCSALRRFFSGSRETEAYTLMTMTPEEKPVFGTGISGEILLRDVRQLAVNFSGHRFTALHAALAPTREDLRRRSFHFLLTSALETIAELKEKEARLDRQHEILEVQYRLQQSRQKGLDSLATPAPRAGRGQAGWKVLCEVRDELECVRESLDEPSDYLEHVRRVLSNPEGFLRVEPVSPRLNQMGIRVKETDPDPGHPIPYAKIGMDSAGRKMAAVLVRVNRAEVMGGIG